MTANFTMETWLDRFGLKVVITNLASHDLKMEIM